MPLSKHDIEKKIDGEIADLEKQIEALKDEVKVRLKSKEYLLSLLSVNGQEIKMVEVQGSRIPASHTARPVSGGVLFPNSSEQGQQPVLISEFVMNLIKEKGEADTKTIIQAWAEYQGQPYNNVRNNVFNALTRMVSSKKLERVPLEGQNNSVYKLKSRTYVNPA